MIDSLLTFNSQKRTIHNVEYNQDTTKMLLVIYLMLSWFGFILATKSSSLSLSSIKAINLVKQEAKYDMKTKEEEEFRPIQIMCEINGFSVAAIIDTGAQVSIMSSSCAKRCHLFNAIDRHFAGKAHGVGSGEILGRIDQMMMRMGPLTFKSRIFVLRDSPVDFLIGLDFLKRFEGEVSLKDNVLRLNVKGKFLRIPFFSESVSMYNRPVDQSSTSHVGNMLVETVMYESSSSPTATRKDGGNEQSKYSSPSSTSSESYYPSPLVEQSLSYKEENSCLGSTEEEVIVVPRTTTTTTAEQVASPLTDMYGDDIEFAGESVSMEGV